MKSPLIYPNSIRKIVEIDSHIGCSIAGLAADAKLLIERARVDAQQHRFTYDEAMSVESIAYSTSSVALRFGEDRDDDTLV